MQISQSLSLFETRTWKKTLSDRPNDGHSEYRSQLRSAFLALHTRVADLVSNIHSDFREYTVHDITHLDALWSVADKITGDNYNLSPTEGFLLGCSFLLHDAGMCVAAYPGGLEELKSLPNWNLAIARAIDRLGNKVSEELLVADVIRQLHAERAADLPNVKWKNANNDEYYLIDDSDIRHRFGATIGKIAASHWWDVADLAKKLDFILPAPHFLPEDWQADLMKVASILRICDAAHIDETRAPGFLWALRKPGAYSNLHWRFQNRLFPPRTEKDAIEFRSQRPFRVDEADSWWQCFDALTLIDEELRSVDVMLADARHDDVRLDIRRVANSGNPLRLSQNIEVLGWIPIDTHISIGDVPDLVRKLGGEALYGRRPHVPIRELVQNSIEAIAFKSEISRKAGLFHKGQVEVKYLSDDIGDYIEICDNGIGMNEDIIIKYLLDFGKSGWSKNFDTQGHLDNNIAKIGKFGIGFFSSLMIADRIELYTRRYDAAVADTLHLRFNNGINARPILSKAAYEDRLLEGGTRIRLYLRSDITLFRQNEKGRYNSDSDIHDLCHELFPLVFCEIKSVDKYKVVIKEPINLTSASNKEIFEACFCKVAAADKILKFIKNMRPFDCENPGLGKLALFPLKYWEYDPQRRGKYLGLLLSNGIKVSHWDHIIGFIEGTITRANRGIADVNVTNAQLARWATEQAELLLDCDLDLEDRRTAVQFISEFGGNPGKISFIEYNKGTMNLAEFYKFIKKKNTIILASEYQWRSAREFDSRIRLKNNVFISDEGHSIMSSDGGEETIFRELFLYVDSDGRRRNTRTIIAEKIASAWSVPLNTVRKYIDYRWNIGEDDSEVRRSLEFIFELDGEDHGPEVMVTKIDKKMFKG